MPGKPTILLAEDDATTAQMIKDILESAEYEVVHVFDGLDAMRRLGIEPTEEAQQKIGDDWKFLKNEWTKDSAPLRPALVISDCMMPRVDGFTLVHDMSFNEDVKGIPVIVLTTKAKMEEPFLQLSNVKGFIAKPADPDHLIETVGKAVGRS